MWDMWQPLSHNLDLLNLGIILEIDQELSSGLTNANVAFQ